MVDDQFATCGDVEAKEAVRGELAGKQPVVWLHDDQGELIDGRAIAVEERFFRALDVELEKKWNVFGDWLGREQCGQREHCEFSARPGRDGAVSQTSLSRIGKVGKAVFPGDTSLTQVHVEMGAVLTEKFEVVRCGFNRNDVGLRVPGVNPEDAGSDI